MNRTGAEQAQNRNLMPGAISYEQDNSKSLKSLEAGTGIEPVFSDLQSGA